MPRSKKKLPRTAATDTFAAAMAPMIKELVREALVEIAAEWAEKNSSKSVTTEPPAKT